MKTSLCLSLLCLVFFVSSAQTNDSPPNAYQWKRGKTEPQAGYVVLKSGKKMEGEISLIGGPGAVSEVAFEGEGKKLNFPVGSLKSYGVNAVPVPVESKVPVNDSPESMYEWRNMGVLMGKVITSTEPRPGYVVLRNGTRYEGELKLRRKDGVLADIDIKTASGKQKPELADVAHYGYTVSEAEVAQAKLAKNNRILFQGSVQTANGTMNGELAPVPNPGKRYYEKIVVKNADGQFTEYDTKSVTRFSYSSKGRTYSYLSIDNMFLAERFEGKTFRLYLNPNPTSINEFATGLAKTAMQVGTTAVATSMVKSDQEKNGYVSNMDSVLAVSTTEQLEELRNNLVTIAGYSSVDEALNQSDNESLKANLNAIELTIQGRKAASTPGGVLNEEWIILNKTSGEKTIVYKSKYKDQIDVLLMGCDKYLELGKSEQKDLQKWDNITAAMKLLDSCY